MNGRSFRGNQVSLTRNMGILDIGKMFYFKLMKIVYFIAVNETFYNFKIPELKIVLILLSKLNILFTSLHCRKQGVNFIKSLQKRDITSSVPK